MMRYSPGGVIHEGTPTPMPIPMPIAVVFDFDDKEEGAAIMEDFDADVGRGVESEDADCANDLGFTYGVGL